MSPNAGPRRSGRTTVVALLAVAAFVVAAGFVGRSVPADAAGKTDFVEYGAAARLLFAGENPYDGSKLLPLQREAGWEQDKADMMWNPPWVFPVVLPTGLLSWPVGLLAWSALQLALVLLSAALVWRVYGGPPRLTGVAVAVAVVFVPTFFLVRLGQISGLLLFGLAGFLAALRAGRPGLAGAAAALTAVKPHLLLPFAVLLVCDALVSRATRVAVLAGAAVVALAAAFPLAWDGDVWAQYVAAVRAPSDEFHWSPSAWSPPTPAAKLRAALDAGLFTQFAPSVLTTAALVGYWWTRRRAWDWGRELPAVVLLSVLTTGYGAWGFDVVVLLLPVVQAAVWLADGANPRLALWTAAAYLAFNAAVFAGLVPVLWWAPIVAAGYFAVALLTRPASRTGPVPAASG